MDYLVRCVLWFHGFIFVYQGMSYINVPQNDVVKAMLKTEALEGPGLDIAVPFLGISYLTIGAFNLLGAVIFSVKDSCLILIASGLFFHFGMATVRSTLEPKSAYYYKTGAIQRTNIAQCIIGLICCIVGIFGYTKNRMRSI